EIHEKTRKQKRVAWANKAITVAVQPVQTVSGKYLGAHGFHLFTCFWCGSWPKAFATKTTKKHENKTGGLGCQSHHSSGTASANRFRQIPGRTRLSSFSCFSWGSWPKALATKTTKNTKIKRVAWAAKAITVAVQPAQTVSGKY
ncbi:MAG: hypothetical protein ACRC02_03385, partial [Vogesella sp.]|uniref:hypothetical protein n=1 Tax=Vogesella sp. TaxID=1904252 RepID=UPI003F3A0397